MGTKTRKALEIEDAFGDLGTTLSRRRRPRDAPLNLEVLKRNLSPALGDHSPTSSRTRRSRRPRSTRERKRQLDASRSRPNEPNGVAGRIRPMLAFGRDHPYGRPAQGFPGTVQGITRDDLVGVPQGSLEAGQLGDRLRRRRHARARRPRSRTQHFGAWSGGAAAPVDDSGAAAGGAGRIYLVDRQDAAQTIVSQSLPASDARHAGLRRARLADAVWGGGGFGTRLNMNLREDKGYSVRRVLDSAAVARRRLWCAAGGVQTDKTKESIVEFDKELKALAGARPITADELDRRQAGASAATRSSSRRSDRVSGEIANLWAQGLPMTELQREYDETATGHAGRRQCRRARSTRVPAARHSPGRRSGEDRGRPARAALGEVVVLDDEGRRIK